MRIAVFVSIVLALAFASIAPAETVELEGSRPVVLDRHNTVGGWEIFASLLRDPESGESWISLQVNDLGNISKKTLDIPHIDFVVDGEALWVECGEAQDAEQYGGGWLYQNTRSSHLCALEASELERLRGATEIQSTVTVNGKERKARSWSSKAVQKFTTLKLRKY